MVDTARGPGFQLDAAEQPQVSHICSIVNTGSTCRVMILTIFLNDNSQFSEACRNHKLNTYFDRY